MATVANQRIIHIMREDRGNRFTQINRENLFAAMRELKEAEFKVWLYLCDNAKGYNLALSQVAVENATGIKKTAYYTAMKGLEEKGYIVHFQGNIYNFYEQPFRDANTFRETEKVKQSFPQNGQSSSQNEQIFPQNGQNSSPSDREINKQINTDKIDMDAFGVIGQREITREAAISMWQYVIERDEQKARDIEAFLERTQETMTKQERYSYIQKIYNQVVEVA